MIDYSVRPPARVGALVALVVTAVAIILFWSAADGGQSASAGINASVSLDAVSDGANTATSVGTIDSCRSLASGETAVLDLVIENVSGLAGFELDLVYDPAILRVVTLTLTIEVDYNFLLAPTSTSVIELGDALPDDGSGTFKLAAAQFPSSPVSGSGVLARFRIEGVGSGSTDIALTTVKLSDGTGTPIPPSDASNVYQGPVNGGSIAVAGLCGDFDGDGVPDESDNCPSWPNPAQNLPPWTVPANDPDCDSFTTTIENFVGTDPNDPCANTVGANDEADDRWPADTNDNQTINVFDVVPYIAALNSVAPNPPYFARLDLNMNAAINVFDIVPFIQLLNKLCSP